MASNRIRSLWTVTSRLTTYESRLTYIDRQSVARRLSPNSIISSNVLRKQVLEPHIGDDAVENRNIANDAVNTDQIFIDAITGKNIASCDIVDSTIDNSTMTNSFLTDVTIEGTTTTITGASIFDGTMDGTFLTNIALEGISTLTGLDVTASGITLEGCYADGLTASSSGLAFNAPGDISFVGGGVTFNGGGSIMTFASGDAGIQVGGTGLQLTGSAVNVFVPNFFNFKVANTSVAKQQHEHDGGGESFSARYVLWSERDQHSHSGGTGAGGDPSHTHSVSVSPSDRNLKRDIENLSLGLDFVERLSPVSYKFINGDGAVIYNELGQIELDEDGKPKRVFREGKRTHFGLIAQDIEELSSEYGLDFGGWVEDEYGLKGLRYMEFIAPLVKSVQELAEMNRQLAARVAELESSDARG